LGELRPACVNSLQDPTSKMTRARGTGGVAQVVEYLPNKCEAPSLTPSSIKKKSNSVYSTDYYKD
jgi:hypothetical protein